MLLPSFSFIACYLSFVSAKPLPQSRTGDAGSADLRQGGLVDAFLTSLGVGVQVPDPPDASPRRQTLSTANAVPGAKRIKIRSGPYVVPNMNRYAIATGEHGMLWNHRDLEIEKPCSECVILRQWAGLEYSNGTNANVDSGLWLHHMVHFISGPGRWDPTCLNRISLPHGRVLQSPSTSERYFTSGNERTPFDFNVGWQNMTYGTGLWVKDTDSFQFIVDLMNMNMEDKLVYVTMTYDILEGTLPAGWEQVKTFWLDVNVCSVSEVPAPKQTGQFTIESIPWKPLFEGRIVGAMAHLHDGGVAMDTMYSTTENMCRQQANYAELPEFKYLGGPMGDDIPAVDHISSMDQCNQQTSRLGKDQSWRVVGHYDYDKRAGNIDRGKQGEVMALSVVWAAIGRQGVERPNMLANWI